MPGLDGLETLEQILAIPDAPPVVFVTASQDSAIAVTALKAGAADYLVKDVQGDFIPLLQVAVNGALRQAAIQQGPRRGRGRGSRLARPLRGARRRTRGAAARGQPPRRQQPADHRLAAAPAGQFRDPGRRQGGADQRDGPRRRGGAGAPPALHLARSEERAAEPVSRSAAGRPPALGRGQQDVAADAEGRADRDRSGPRGRDRHHRQRAGDERREIRLSRRRRPDPRRAQGAGRRSRCSSIADDGVGLNVKTDPRSTGMGQRIVTAMASKLEANVERDPAHSGTRIVLRFRRVQRAGRAEAGTVAGG